MTYQPKHLAGDHWIIMDDESSAEIDLNEKQAMAVAAVLNILKSGGKPLDDLKEIVDRADKAFDDLMAVLFPA